MEDLKEMLDEVKRKVVTDKALETASTLASLLSILDEDSDDLCQVLMIMHHLAKGRELQTQVRQHIDNAHVKDTTLVTPGSTQVH
jgi:hypothetical protein